ARVNTRIMGPALGDRWRGGLESAQASAARSIANPHRKPRAGRLVIQNNRIASRIRERALTDGDTAVLNGCTGQPVKSSATVSGNRCAGNIDWAGVATA